MIKDSSGEKSVTMTVFVIGFIVVCLKLLVSDLDILGYHMSTFTGVDFAAAVTGLGGIYILRRKKKGNKDEKII